MTSRLPRESGLSREKIAGALGLASFGQTIPVVINPVAAVHGDNSQ
ncbi:hypothetical protein P7H16_18545 [Paenibacillus larvae]|nr:hypothetical protein [Paenibacillus larvae]